MRLPDPLSKRKRVVRQAEPEHHDEVDGEAFYLLNEKGKLAEGKGSETRGRASLAAGDYIFWDAI